MKTPTGTAIVEAISQILDRQNREGQVVKKLQAKRVLENFTLEHQLDEKSFNALPRLLRKFDSDDFRQIRSMSDSLIDMDEQELRAELTALKELLKPIEARIHQVKTKTAFVSTVLRPFYAKYTSIWFQERNDIDIKQAKAKIEQLERIELDSVDEFVRWTRDVSDLFEQVVVYRGIDAADPYARPTGTVSEKSSKTYLQAWNAFLDHFHAELWKMAGGSVFGDGQSSSRFIPKRSSESFSYEFEDDDSPGLDQDVPDQRRERKSMLMAPPSDYLEVRSLKAPPRSRAPKDARATSPRANQQSIQWIQIFIESKTDSSAQATRKWESQADFSQSLQKWLDTLPVIWGPAAKQFLAKVSVKTATGESDLTLPSLTVKDAADRLTQAVEMQQD
jgi:hypothetical protein